MMFSFERLRSVLLCSLSLWIGHGSLAQAQAFLSMHRACIDGGMGEKLFLQYWPAMPDNGIPEPVCVVKTPALERLPVRSAHVTPDRRFGIGAIVVVEFDETARPLIEKMSRENVGKLMAIVVDDRIVSMPAISRPFSDNKLPIGAANDREVARILSALRVVPDEGKK